MINTLIKYDKIPIDDYLVSDYTSKDFSNISELEILNDETWFDYYLLKDSETLENVSYKVYSNPDYWDIILLINAKDPLNDLAFSYDMILTSVEQKLIDYQTKYNNTNQSFLDTLKELLLNDATLKNDKNRVIKLIKPSRLGEFLQYLAVNKIIKLKD